MGPHYVGGAPKAARNAAHCTVSTAAVPCCSAGAAQPLHATTSKTPDICTSGERTVWARQARWCFWPARFKLRGLWTLRRAVRQQCACGAQRCLSTNTITLPRPQPALPQGSIVLQHPRSLPSGSREALANPSRTERLQEAQAPEGKDCPWCGNCRSADIAVRYAITSIRSTHYLGLPRDVHLRIDFDAASTFAPSSRLRSASSWSPGPVPHPPSHS